MGYLGRVGYHRWKGWLLPSDGPSAGPLATVQAPQVNRARLTPDTEVMPAGQVAIEPLPHKELSLLPACSGNLDASDHVIGKYERGLSMGPGIS